MQIKIKHIEVKKSEKGSEYKIVEADNFRASVFKESKSGLLDGYDDLQVGNTVEVETSQSGKYTNVTKITLVKSEPTPQPIHDAFKYFEQTQMNRRTALMQSCATTQNHDVRSILNRAEDFVNWLEKDVMPQSTEEAQIFAPQQATGVSKKGTDVTEIGTLGELYTVCLDKWKMTPTAVLRALGAKTNTEIKATPQKAYEQIKNLKEIK